jgi:hypothetical protein
MLEPSIRLYGAANAMVYVFFALMLFPAGLALGIIAAIFSCVITLPVLIALCLFFGLLRRIRPGIYCSWVLLFVVVGLCAWLPFWVFGLHDDFLFRDSIFQLVAVASAYLALLFQLPFFNQYLLSLHHKNNNHENN